MNLGEVKRRVFRTLGDESGALFVSDDVIDWANDAQLDIVRRTHCLTGDTTFDVVSGTDNYDLPEDFLSETRVTLDGLGLCKTTLEQLNQAVPDRDSVFNTGGLGTPGYFYVWGNKLYLWPIPTTAGTANLRLFYSIRPVRVLSDQDVFSIPVQYHSEIVTYCLARGKELDEEENVSREYQSRYEEGVNQARSEVDDPHDDSYPAVRTLPGDNGELAGYY